MASSTAPLSSSLLVMAAGSTVVTWDCHRQQQEQDSSNNNNNSKHTSFQALYPFGPEADHAPTISDVAWNHNGQVLACCSSLPTNTPNNNTIKNNKNANHHQSHNIILTSTHSGSRLDSFCHNDPNSANNNFNNNNNNNNNPASTGSVHSYGSTSLKSSHHPSTSTHTISSPTAAATCVAFGGKSRYLCLGDNQGGVCLWDLKKHSRVRQFLSKSVATSSSKTTAKSLPIRQACLDPTATYVCALSAQHWTLYHLRQATLTSQWLSASYSTSSSNNHHHHHGWQQFRFSPLQPNVLALADSAGRIQLHASLEQECPVLVCGGPSSSPASTTTTSTTAALTHQTSPVTGLAFSTQNSKLLANCRANGILEFVDTTSGEVIHHQQTCTSTTTTTTSSHNASAAPSATALAFQGVTCVVGTNRGECQVYDLRMMMQQFGKAVTTFDMQQQVGVSSQNMPITALEFSPLIKQVGGAAGGTMLRSSNSFTSVNSMVSFDLETKGSTSSLHPEQPSSTLSTLAAAAASTSSNNNNHNNNASSKTQAAAEVTKTTPSSEATNIVTTVSEEEGVEVSHAPNNVVQPPPPPPPPQSAAPPKSPRKHKILNQPQHQTNTKSVTESTSTANNVANNTPAVIAKNPLAPESAAISTTKDTTHVSNATAPKSSTTTTASSTTSRTRYLLEDDSAMMPQNQVGHLELGGGDDSVNNSNNTNLSTMIRTEIQTQFLTLRDDMEESVRNLHVDMLRQFQRQSQELMQVVARQEQRMDRILEENRLLREQNQELQRRLAGNPPRTKWGGTNGFHR